MLQLISISTTSYIATTLLNYVLSPYSTYLAHHVTCWSDTSDNGFKHEERSSLDLIKYEERSLWILFFMVCAWALSIRKDLIFSVLYVRILILSLILLGDIMFMFMIVISYWVIYLLTKVGQSYSCVCHISPWWPPAYLF